MIVCLMWVGYFTGAGTLGAFLATVLLVVSVGLSLVVGVAASYWIVRVVLGAFGSRVAEPVMERARAAAAGD
jgi:general stress protein CsbA